ncbi:helix-turn-helix domain-containing protein [Pseudomonas protegens]|uniref:helix-turn-helix domain-containing protein n=1 Tax=Pseudomonas protegens TaxID=380021 RepID=UPI0015766F65|nr:helix-turn-helix transcriptional regulator [Pseudomonas protegens]NTZ70544.1 helix-turn-helix transcriptional regulator [Pseudomonas protegens]QEN46572.1 hypothetical protein CLA18_08635 [Pseudomonas protegens]
MDNFEIAKQIQEDVEVFSLSRRAAPVFEIKRIMIEKGLKNIDIAERLGVTEANVSRWLRGDQNLKLDTLYLLADAIQVKFSISFGGQERAVSLSELSFSETEVETFEMPMPYAKPANDLRYKNFEAEGEANEGYFAFG